MMTTIFSGFLRVHFSFSGLPTPLLLTNLILILLKDNLINTCGYNDNERKCETEFRQSSLKLIDIESMKKTSRYRNLSILLIKISFESRTGKRYIQL